MKVNWARSVRKSQLTSPCSGGIEMVGGSPRLVAAAELGRYAAESSVGAQSESHLLAFEAR